jgi:hypothetical protein
VRAWLSKDCRNWQLGELGWVVSWELCDKEHGFAVGSEGWCLANEGLESVASGGDDNEAIFKFGDEYISVHKGWAKIGADQSIRFLEVGCKSKRNFCFLKDPL